MTFYLSNYSKFDISFCLNGLHCTSDKLNIFLGVLMWLSLLFGIIGSIYWVRDTKNIIKKIFFFGLIFLFSSLILTNLFDNPLHLFSCTQNVYHPTCMSENVYFLKVTLEYLAYLMVGCSSLLYILGKCSVKKSDIKKPLFLLLLILAIIVIVLSFNFGLHWHATYYRYFGIPDANLTCYSHTNLTESYQTNCVLPLDNSFFQFKNHLECQAVTNNQFGQNNDHKRSREEIVLIKSDYHKFSLDFKDNKIIRSKDVGSFPKNEDYTIMKDSHGIIQAMRPVQNENLDKNYEYEFISFSKNTGHGMQFWHNVKKEKEAWTDDSMAMYFFKCE